MTRPRTATLAAALLAFTATAAHAADLRGPAPQEGDAYEFLITGEATERGRHIVAFDFGDPVEGTIESELHHRLRYDITDLTRGTVTGAEITYVEVRTESEYRIRGESTEEINGQEINGMSLRYEVEDGYWACDVDATMPLVEDYKDIMEHSGFYDPRLLYPAGDIAPDTTWTVTGDAIGAFPGSMLFPGAPVEGGAEFKFLGVEEIEGQPIAVIAITMDVAFEVDAVMQNWNTTLGGRQQFQGHIYRNLDTYLDTVVMEGVATTTQRYVMPGGVSTTTRIEPRSVRIEQSVPNRGTQQRRPGPVILDADPQEDDAPQRDADPRRPAPVPLPDADTEPMPEPAPRPAPRPAPIPNDNGNGNGNAGPRPAPAPSPSPAPRPGPRPQ